MREPQETTQGDKLRASLVAQTVKDPPAMQETQARSLTREDPLGYPSKEQLPTPVFLLGESYGQRSLVGYSPWGCKEPDMAKVTACTESPELEHFYDLPMFRVLDGEYCENYK